MPLEPCLENKKSIEDLKSKCKQEIRGMKIRIQVSSLVLCVLSLCKALNIQEARILNQQ